MTNMALVWIPALLLAWVYAGYPLLAWILGRLRPHRPQPTLPTPTISVAIAVHNEAGDIDDRIADVLAQAGPGVLIEEVLVGSDGSTDETAAIVAAIAARDPRVRLLDLPRSGQTPTQQALFAAATADIVVLTDAETRFAPGCLAALADALRDPRVGCATGRLEWRSEDATATSANEGLYWRYERWVRAAESRAGLLTAVTGALLAVRRSEFRPVPAEASMDHLLPLYVREAGGTVLYVPKALATDRPISGIREQFLNRTRTATRGIRSNLSMAGRLAPWRRPGAALAIWSHKLLRWATPWLVAWFALGGLLASPGKARYGLAPLAVAAGAVLAAAGHLMISHGRRPPRPIAFLRAFAVVNVAFARASVDVARGRRISEWRPAAADATESHGDASEIAP